MLPLAKNPEEDVLLATSKVVPINAFFAIAIPPAVVIEPPFVTSVASVVLFIPIPPTNLKAPVELEVDELDRDDVIPPFADNISVIPTVDEKVAEVPVIAPIVDIPRVVVPTVLVSPLEAVNSPETPTVDENVAEDVTPRVDENVADVPVIVPVEREVKDPTLVI